MKFMNAKQEEGERSVTGREDRWRLALRDPIRATKEVRDVSDQGTGRRNFGIKKPVVEEQVEESETNEEADEDKFARRREERDQDHETLRKLQKKRKRK